MTITATNANRTDTARALLAANPELTGAELGRALNVSDRCGRQLLHELNGTGEGKPARTLMLISFGYLHQPGEVPPAADRVEDVRERLRDPAAARDILDLDGLHPHVQQVVLATPGAAELIDNLIEYAELPAGPRSIAVGCSGGKHRACALIQLLGERLRGRGHRVTIEHRHAHLPRVLTPTAGGSGTAPTLDVAREPDRDGSKARRTPARAVSGFGLFGVVLVLLLIAALSSAPAPITVPLAVLAMVALIAWVLRLAPPRSRTDR
ncbi:RNase adapter RapZ [Nonomuraea sp. NPDC026600]|uniref:RapZ C-terminal domain-containing protein n=1 Tax=Nonomuraea sp. NPDC026600 TaxID=3155363 RepID=UPI00340BB37E